MADRDRDDLVVALYANQYTLGGRLGYYRTYGSGGAWEWRVNGRRARGIMLTLYILMSPHRQAQIRGALARLR